MDMTKTARDQYITLPDDLMDSRVIALRCEAYQGVEALFIAICSVGQAPELVKPRERCVEVECGLVDGDHSPQFPR